MVQQISGGGFKPPRKEHNMEYRGYTIEELFGGYTVFYHGDEIFFETLDGAKEFIDELNA